MLQSLCRKGYLHVSRALALWRFEMLFWAGGMISEPVAFEGRCAARSLAQKSAQSAISTRRFATSASRWSACGICRNQARSLGRRFAKASYTAAVHPPKPDRRASSNLRGQGVEKFAGRTHGSSSSSITPHGGSAPPQSPGGALRLWESIFLWASSGVISEMAASL